MVLIKSMNYSGLNILFKNKKVVKMTFNIDKEEIIKHYPMFSYPLNNVFFRLSRFTDCLYKLFII